jgi:hypothetical protein
MASVKVRSTGPKSGAPSTWHPPQHSVGTAKLRLAGLHHEVGGNTTRVADALGHLPRLLHQATAGVDGDNAHSLARLQLPCGSGLLPPPFLLLPPSSSQRPTAPGGSPHGSSGRDFAAPAAKGYSAPRVAALVFPLLSLPPLLLLFSDSWWWRGFGWGSGRPAGDWALIGGRLGFGAPEGRRGSSASVPRGTRCTSGGGGDSHGAGAAPCPTARHGRCRREEKQTGESGG